MDLLFKLQDEFSENSTEMKVLKRVIVYCKNFRRGFSACDFFDLNKSVIFSLVGNVATYVIISIQLNENQKL